VKILLQNGAFLNIQRYRGDGGLERVLYKSNFGNAKFLIAHHATMPQTFDPEEQFSRDQLG